MIRNLAHRLTRLERRLAPPVPLPSFLVQFVSPEKKVVATLRLEEGKPDVWTQLETPLPLKPGLRVP